MKIPKDAKGPVRVVPMTVTIKSLGTAPNCSLEESMVAVFTTTYVGYVYIDASGRKFATDYPAWDPQKGNTTVSGPYTVIETKKQGWKCLSENI
ncbi:hypothetical protein [Streptomyces sp. NPDC059744]|uniref:hypothetical protein n=1 Tax=Streptomyces sp. NPDC059744 TaxID=3346929 RepID=UPI0036660528